jgi:hypothetical protein
MLIPQKIMLEAECRWNAKTENKLLNAQLRKKTKIDSRTKSKFVTQNGRHPTNGRFGVAKRNETKRNEDKNVSSSSS